MPAKRVSAAKPRCPQVHRRDTASVPRACGPCGQRAPRHPEDLTFETVAHPRVTLVANKSATGVPLALSRKRAGEGHSKLDFIHWRGL
jgi:hypothetical protein